MASHRDDERLRSNVRFDPLVLRIDHREMADEGRDGQCSGQHRRDQERALDNRCADAIDHGIGREVYAELLPVEVRQHGKIH